MTSYCCWLVHSFKKDFRVGLWKTRLDVTSGEEFFGSGGGIGNWVQVPGSCKGSVYRQRFGSDGAIFGGGQVGCHNLVVDNS
jgi:hypothetical protein